MPRLIPTPGGPAWPRCVISTFPARSFSRPYQRVKPFAELPPWCSRHRRTAKYERVESRAIGAMPGKKPSFLGLLRLVSFATVAYSSSSRSEEHTSELQSLRHL